jgi:hypothetical protein
MTTPIDCRDAERAANIAKLDGFLRDWHRKYRPRTVTSPPPTAYDPVAVGLQARKLMDAAFEAGRELSATEAVHHVLAQAGYTCR